MTEKLKSKDFQERVFDYQKENQWKFKGKIPAIIDFYADWCGPCQMVAPVLERISEKYKGKINVYKVNVDEEIELAHHFQIRSIPTMLFIPIDSKPIGKMGFMSEQQIEKSIQDDLLKSKKI
ncbi:thioredoxin [Candidatus Woesearchaeota archaeon]|nr:thioredoxin [Candidatus Woesearchaeota archaeon]